MSEQCPDILRCDPQNLRQAMSIHTRKITDACRDKDCVEDLRVYLTAGSQQTLDSAANVRVRSAQLLHTYIDVEPVAFDRNHYCIDITFYYRILADAVVGTCRPAALSGLAVFSKRAVLCGEDSRAHIFTSDTRIGEADGCTLSSSNRPTAVVKVLEPMVLSGVRHRPDSRRHPGAVRRRADHPRRPSPPVRHPRTVLHRPAGTGCAAGRADGGIRHPRKGMLRQRGLLHRRPLRNVQPHSLPRPPVHPHRLRPEERNSLR